MGLLRWLLGRRRETPTPCHEWRVWATPDGTEYRTCVSCQRVDRLEVVSSPDGPWFWWRRVSEL